MKRKRLFDQDEILNDFGSEVSKEINYYLEEKIIALFEKNISLIDLEALLHQNISMLMSRARIRRRLMES